MKSVTWVIHCQTMVDTDDDKVASAQVGSLFNNSMWGDRDGNELCVTTFQACNVLSVRDV